jgi:hypothetical protein
VSGAHCAAWVLFHVITTSALHKTRITLQRRDKSLAKAKRLVSSTAGMQIQNLMGDVLGPHFLTLSPFSLLPLIFPSSQFLGGGITYTFLCLSPILTSYLEENDLERRTEVLFSMLNSEADKASTQHRALPSWALPKA